MRLIVFFLFLAASTSCAFSQEMSGNDILDGCRVVSEQASKDNAGEDTAFFVAACGSMIHTLMITGRDMSKNKFCSPVNATVQQAAKVLVKFLDDHPEDLNARAVVLALAAFRVAWPCPNPN